MQASSSPSSTLLPEKEVKSTNITQESTSNTSVVSLLEASYIGTENTEKRPTDAAIEVNLKLVSASDAPVASTESNAVPMDENRIPMNTRSLSTRFPNKKPSSSGGPNTRTPGSRSGRGPTSNSKKTEFIDLTKPPTLPPLDLGASIAEPGLEGTVKRIEIQLRGLKLQFEQFRRAHVKLIHDHKELLDAHCQELGDSVVKKRDGSIESNPVRRKENERASMKNSANGGLETLESDKELAPSRSVRSHSVLGNKTAHGRGRSPTRARIIRRSPSASPIYDFQLHRASPETERGTSQARSLPIHGSHDTQTRRGISRHISPQRSASRRASSNPCPSRSRAHVRSGEPSHSRSRPSKDRTVPDGQPRPRTLPRRVTSLTTSRPQELLSVGLGADFDAFPRWSKLGLDTMDTFKTAQGPSAVRKWKSGKLSTKVA